MYVREQPEALNDTSCSSRSLPLLIAFWGLTSLYFFIPRFPPRHSVLLLGSQDDAYFVTWNHKNILDASALLQSKSSNIGIKMPENGPFPFFLLHNKSLLQKEMANKIALDALHSLPFNPSIIYVGGRCYFASEETASQKC